MFKLEHDDMAGDLMRYLKEPSEAESFMGDHISSANTAPHHLEVQRLHQQNSQVSDKIKQLRNSCQKKIFGDAILYSIRK